MKDLTAQHAIDCCWRVDNPAVHGYTCDCELGELRQLQKAMAEWGMQIAKGIDVDVSEADNKGGE